MWITILLQALFFALTHASELIEIIRALMAFFKAHRANPQMTVWMQEFPLVLQECEEKHNPGPLQDFLNKISATIQEKK